MQVMASPKFQVFISHAGEDKKTIAFPLREMLSARGITAFVDDRDIKPGEDATEEMTSAMHKADIAVIVLSPEFVAKKWPMKELLFFLKRREDALTNGMAAPVILPVFYRLSVAELYEEPKLDRRCADGSYLFWNERFYERNKKGEPEADADIIKNALRTLHEFQGVENKPQGTENKRLASNEASSRPLRLLFLEAIAEQVSQIVERQMSARDVNDELQHYFAAEALQKVVLNFVCVDKDGKPLTDEGDIKHRIVTLDAKHGVCTEHPRGMLPTGIR